MTNLELQEGIVQNLLLGLKKQSEAYLDLISNNEYTHDQRKDFEKELSDINKVLNELSGKTISYTVAELEALKVQFNDRLTQLNSIITNLEINTLKIEFDSLTPEQKAFLKGEKGDKGEKGENSYELAVRYGFVGNEIEYLNSLKGKDGVDGVNGVNGVNGINGVDGQDGLSLTYDSLTSAQKQDLVSFFATSGVILDINNFLNGLNENFSTFEQNFMAFSYQFNSLVSRVEALETNQNTTSPNEDENNLVPFENTFSFEVLDNTIVSNGYFVKTDYIPQIDDELIYTFEIDNRVFTAKEKYFLDEYNYLQTEIVEENRNDEIYTCGFGHTLLNEQNFNPDTPIIGSIFITRIYTTPYDENYILNNFKYSLKILRNGHILNVNVLETSSDRVVKDSWQGL